MMNTELQIREDALRALRASQGERRMIIDPALDAILVMDGRGFITEWNSQATQLFGRSKSDVVGRCMPEIIVPPPLREEYLRGLQRFALDGEWAVLNRRVETTALHQDGHEFPVELTIFPLLNEGVRSFSVFVRDLSKRKVAEYVLQRETSFCRVVATRGDRSERGTVRGAGAAVHPGAGLSAYRVAGGTRLSS